MLISQANNFNGDNLIDCDQKILQEMGIKKVGDRVRIFVAIKQLRNKTMVDPRQKNMVAREPRSSHSRHVLTWHRKN
jgi:mitogen-activated protein kinase kinase kinase